MSNITSHHHHEKSSEMKGPIQQVIHCVHESEAAFQPTFESYLNMVQPEILYQESVERNDKHSTNDLKLLDLEKQIQLSQAKVRVSFEPKHMEFQFQE
jgi:hypothetical protein